MTCRDGGGGRRHAHAEREADGTHMQTGREAEGTLTQRRRWRQKVRGRRHAHAETEREAGSTHMQKRWGRQKERTSRDGPKEEEDQQLHATHLASCAKPLRHRMVRAQS